MNIIEEKSGYNEIKPLFEKNLPKDYKIYQEFHALIVEHAKSIRKIR
jgi:endonuclease-3 related protein